MCNTIALKTYIYMSEFTVSELCRSLKISRQTFYNHLNNKTDWRPYQVKKLKDLLDLTDEQAVIIFSQD